MYKKKTIRFKVAVPVDTFNDILACRDLWHKHYAPEYSDKIPVSEFCTCLLDQAATEMLLDSTLVECLEVMDKGC